MIKWTFCVCSRPPNECPWSPKVRRTSERPWQGRQDRAQEPARGLYRSERLEGGPPDVVCERVVPQVKRHRLEATKAGHVGGVHAGHHVLHRRNERRGQD